MREGLVTRIPGIGHASRESLASDSIRGAGGGVIQLPARLGTIVKVDTEFSNSEILVSLSVELPQ